MTNKDIQNVLWVVDSILYYCGTLLKSIKSSLEEQERKDKGEEPLEFC